MIQINDMVNFRYSVTEDVNNPESGKKLIRLMKSISTKYGTRAMETSIELSEVCKEDSILNIEGPQWGSTWDANYCTKPSVLCYEVFDTEVSDEMKKLINFFNAKPIIKEDEKYIKGDK